MGLIIRESSVPTSPLLRQGAQIRAPRRLDLFFWYSSGFGSPVARAQGIGYVQELVARLTKTPIETVRFNHSTSFIFRSVDHRALPSTTRPPTQHWTATRSHSPWTDAPSMSTPPMKSSL